MPVRPLRFDDDAKTMDVWHDEFGHGGTVALSKVKFAPNIGGGDDHDCIVVECPIPGCDSNSTHPVAGGCDADLVQRLFARHYIAAKEFPKVTTWDHAVAEIEKRVAAQEGPHRFKLAESSIDERDHKAVADAELARTLVRVAEEAKVAGDEARASIAEHSAAEALLPVFDQMVALGIEPKEAATMLIEKASAP